jgi:eukaryotic-like serine/threonine-protein kinase
MVPGTVIGEQVGNYNVVRKLGEGGMGTVYEGVHPIIGRRVALKVLRQERCDDDDLVKRFFSEARVVNDIRHDHIVEVIDLARLPSGAYYLTMEYLEGESLAARLAREKPLAPELAVRIASETADALGAAHAKGVVHRDIKADNIFLIPRGDRSDYVKVLDFGIAKLTTDTGGATFRTRTGAVIGTPAYMSPEQCAGLKAIDHRSDIYSLGVLLYEMVTGKVPFEAEGMGLLLLKQMQRDPHPPSAIRPGIPSGLEHAILRAMAKAPANRFASMSDLRAALDRCLDTAPAHSAPRTDLTPVGGVPSGAMLLQTEIAPPPPSTAPTQVSTTFSGSAAEAMKPLRRSHRGIVGVAAGAALLGVGWFLFARGEHASAPQAPVAARPASPTASGPEAPAPAAPTPSAPQPALPRLYIVSTPVGATVRIGERTLGVTPFHTDMARGDAVLSFDKPGYEPLDKAVSVRGDEDLNVTLVPKKKARRKSGTSSDDLTKEL